MRKFALISLLIGLATATGFWAAAQVQAPPVSLSDWMPGGALLYLESPDFATQLRDWNRSQVKSKWLASKNHEEFLTTRLMLKLNDVYAEFSNAAGFSPNLTELETVVGTNTAIALYDIGTLGFVYISRLPAAQVGQNVLTRVRPGYETRNAAGQTYFVRQNGGKTSAFAVAGDYVVVSTREDLLSRALELMRAGGAGESVSQAAWYADALRAMPVRGSDAPTFRLVVDLPNVIKTPYFRSYWIQRNTNDLQGYSAFLAQLNRAADRFEETRVLLRSAEVQIATHEPAVAELQRYIPEGVGLFRLWDTSSTAFAMDLIRQKFFTAGPGIFSQARYAPGLNLDGFAGSNRDLQTRIDEAPKPSLAGVLDLEPLRTLVDSAGLEAVLHLESSIPIGEGTFLGRDAAVALRAASPWNIDQIRSALTSAAASYQSVENIGLQWQNAVIGGYTFSQWNGLVPLTVYVNGQTLWIARTPALLSAALSRPQGASAQAATFAARYRHRGELSSYLKLMRMLDLSDQANYSNFFSENLGSLASALDIVESISVTINNSGPAERQSVTYQFAR